MATKRVLIVTSHFPPSNLATAHRARLLAPHLLSLGWEPIVLTIAPKYYEERLEPDLLALVDEHLRIETVRAIPTRPIRLVGDAGVRGFVSLTLRVLKIVFRERIDFLLLVLPSFFIAPIGRIVHAISKVPYGLDYSDPWVNSWPGSDVPFTKAWVSRRLSQFLEPFSVKRAALIMGVSQGSFAGVLERNPQLRERVITAAIPYGGEPQDHAISAKIGMKARLFDARPGKFRLVYAGTMWPAAEKTLEHVFKAICQSRDTFSDVELHFIGTGRSPNDPTPQIAPLAAKYELSESIVFEHAGRLPYLEALAHLRAADGIFLFGSVEPHYTPSKVYQAILAKRPILAVLHEESEGIVALRQSGAGVSLPFAGEGGLGRIDANFVNVFRLFRSFADRFDPTTVDNDIVGRFSAERMAGRLSTALTAAIAASAEKSTTRPAVT